MKIDETFIRPLPKVLLHDHLDGGLRSHTIIDLAKEQRYKALPTTDPGDLARWFHRGAQRLPRMETWPDTADCEVREPTRACAGPAR